MAPTAPPGVLTPHRPEPYRENADRIDGVEVYRERYRCPPPPLVLGSLYDADTEFGWIGRPPADAAPPGRRPAAAAHTPAGRRRASSRGGAPSPRMPGVLSPYDSYHPAPAGPAYPTYSPSYRKGPGGIYRRVEPELVAAPSFVPPVQTGEEYPVVRHASGPGTFVNPACSQCRREYGWCDPAAYPVDGGWYPGPEPACPPYPVRPQRLIEDRRPARRR